MSERLLAALKRASPAKVRAYTSDDDYRDVAIPGGRKRWGQVIKVILGSSWSRVELLDKAGAVIDFVDNTGPASELESLDDNSRAARSRNDAEWIVTLVIKAQKEAMAYRDSEVQALLQAQGSVVREMSASMTHLATLYRAQVEAASDVATARAQAEATAAGGDDWKQLIEAMPTILQALPVIRAMLQQPAAPSAGKPKNGA
jgi:hypothetical protein